ARGSFLSQSTEAERFSPGYNGRGWRHAARPVVRVFSGGCPMYPRVLSIAMSLAVGCAVLPLGADDQKPPAAGATNKLAGQKPSGRAKRVPWTTSRVRGSPEP